MIQKVLQTKSWVIFMLIVGMPILLQMAFPPFSPTFSSKIIIPIISGLFSCGLFLWIYSIASGLQDKIPQAFRLKFRKFKVIYWISILLLISISIASLFSLPSIIDISGLFMLLMFICMYGILYSIYFAAKTIKTVELQRKVGFSDFAGEFFLIWFFFVGIFFIQPKVNKLISK